MGVEQLLLMVSGCFSDAPRTAAASVGLLWALKGSRHQPSSANLTHPSTLMWEDKCTPAAWAHLQSTQSHGESSKTGQLGTTQIVRICIEDWDLKKVLNESSKCNRHKWEQQTREWAGSCLFFLADQRFEITFSWSKPNRDDLGLHSLRQPHCWGQQWGRFSLLRLFLECVWFWRSTWNLLKIQQWKSYF